MVQGVTILGVFDVFDKFVVEDTEAFSVFFGSGNGDLRLLEVDGEARMVTVVGIKRRVIGGFLNGVVVCEFGDREEGDPVVLLVVAVDAEILFDDLVHAFGLAVSLRVERGGQTRLGTEEFREGCPELRGEDRSTIGHEGFWEAVESDDVVHKQASEFRGGRGLVARDEVSHLGEAIHKNEESIVTFREGEIYDKVT